MPNGTLQIYASVAGAAAPLAGVTVVVLDESGVQLARLTTDDAGAAGELSLPAPDKSYSLDESNSTVRPYSVYTLRAFLTGWQTVELEGVQLFDGQQTVARLDFLPADEAVALSDKPVIIPEHPLFAGGGGSGPAPAEDCPGISPQVLTEVVVPKKITVHLARPAVSASNV